MKYKYLTNEMKKILDEKIKEIGRSKLYDTINYNRQVERIAQLQNEDGAFNVIRKGPWTTTQWEYKFFYEADMDCLWQEMLYYVDKKRFNLI